MNALRSELKDEQCHPIITASSKTLAVDISDTLLQPVTAGPS
jgi:hypothetical protein